MVGPRLIDPFHRQLHLVLSDERAERIEGLAKGSAAAIVDSNQTVAEKYAAQVMYIKALTDVLDKCAEIERDMYGGKKEE